MSKRLDLIGKKFGRLTVVSLSCVDKRQCTIWNCVCECGNAVKVVGKDLAKGHTKSCGCLSMDKLLQRNIKHGLADTLIYKIWQGMKDRCTNPNNPKYKCYGGRGIKVCDKWLKSFESFCADMKDRPSSLYTIDRIDVNGDYEPNNCRWATPKEQANNTRRNHLLSYNNETHTLSEWESIVKIKQTTIRQRLRRGWPINDALTRPLRQKQLKFIG